MQALFVRAARRRQCGQSLVEVCVACIALVPLAIGLVYIGQYIHIKQTVQQAAREVARDAAVLKDQGVGDAMSAMSTAQVYYDRPWWNLPFMRPHSGIGSIDGAKQELGNLFEPYWQVRLVPTPTLIKAGLIGSQMAKL